MLICLEIDCFGKESTHPYLYCILFHSFFKKKEIGEYLKVGLNSGEKDFFELSHILNDPNLL